MTVVAGQWTFVVSIMTDSGQLLIYACPRCFALVGWGPQDIDGAKKIHDDWHQAHGDA
jgi:hypothetical protein